jgi:hypothetical protein
MMMPADGFLLFVDTNVPEAGVARTAATIYGSVDGASGVYPLVGFHSLDRPRASRAKHDTNLSRPRFMTLRLYVPVASRKCFPWPQQGLTRAIC